MRPSGTSSTPVCSWPPSVPALGSSHSNLAGHRTSPPSSDSARKSSRATFLKSTSARNAPDHFFQNKPTKPMRTSSWKSENLLQPIRTRTNFMPSVRRPPGEPWRSDPALAKAIHALVGPADSSCSAPPGLPPRQPELRHSGSASDLHTPGSLSLSLALGSQPLKASEPTKAVPPIGAERSRAVSTTSHRNSSGTDRPWCPALLSPRLQAKWNNDVYLLDTTSFQKAQVVVGDSSTSKEDLERLLRHAVHNKYATKIISPLNPLRTATPAFDLSTDPQYQLRMPSPSNNSSSRYSTRPRPRVRTYVPGLFSLIVAVATLNLIFVGYVTVTRRLTGIRLACTAKSANGTPLARGCSRSATARSRFTTHNVPGYRRFRPVGRGRQLV